MPIILVIVGSIDLVKGMMSQQEDEIKKGQKIFVKRLIAAACMFLIVVVVKLMISIVADSTNNQNISSCMDAFLNGRFESDASCDKEDEPDSYTTNSTTTNSNNETTNKKTPFSTGAGQGGGGGGGGGR